MKDQETTQKNTITLRPTRPGDWGWILYKHGDVFSKEFDWDMPLFELYVIQILQDVIAKTIKEPFTRGWIAELNGEPVGSIICVKHSETEAKLRLLLVLPEARGFGIGPMLVKESIEHARNNGLKKVILFTTGQQQTAVKMYDRFGFKVVETFKYPEFGTDMDGINMELTL